MFQGIRNAYGALGVALFLIALYIVLERGTAASSIISSVGGNTASIFKTLQGR